MPRKRAIPDPIPDLTITFDAAGRAVLTQHGQPVPHETGLRIARLLTEAYPPRLIVYAAFCDRRGAYKIGFSEHPASRVKALKARLIATCPCPDYPTIKRTQAAVVAALAAAGREVEPEWFALDAAAAFAILTAHGLVMSD